MQQAAHTNEVQILLFSLLRERVGASSITVTLEKPESARELVERLAEAHPAIRPAISSIRVAVNHEYVDQSHVIRNGDEVALITPVSGG